MDIEIVIKFENPLELSLWNAIRSDLGIESESERDSWINNYKPKILSVHVDGIAKSESEIYDDSSDSEEKEEPFIEENLCKSYYLDDNAFELNPINNNNNKLNSFNISFKQDIDLYDLAKLIKDIDSKSKIKSIELDSFIKYAFYELGYFDTSTTIFFNDSNTEKLIYLNSLFKDVLKNINGILDKKISNKQLKKEIFYLKKYNISLEIRIKQVKTDLFKDEKFTALIFGFWQLTDDLFDEINNAIDSKFNFTIVRNFYQLDYGKKGYEYSFKFIGKKAIKK
jgi:hypothetical protein